MKFYQLNYEFADKVNYTKYFQSYDKAKDYFKQLIKTVSKNNPSAEVFPYKNNSQGSITDWYWVSLNDSKILDVSIVTKKTED